MQPFRVKVQRKAPSRMQEAGYFLLVSLSPPCACTGSDGADREERGALKPTLEESVRTEEINREIRGSRIPYCEMNVTQQQPVLVHTRYPCTITYHTTVHNTRLRLYSYSSYVLVLEMQL